MGKKAEFIKGLLTNDLRVAEFALNNICTAKCQFCSIWSQKEKFTVPTLKAKEAIHKLKSLGVRLLTLTGGEPLLHPDFKEIASYASSENIFTTTITADYRILNEKRIQVLAESQVDIMGISIDHHTEIGIMHSRKIPKAIEGIRKALARLKEIGLETTACVLISHFNYQELAELFSKCQELGFDTISVNYPVFSPSPTYTLGGEAINISRQDLISTLYQVIELKKYYPILNPTASLKNIISFLEGKKTYFTWLGGYRALFIDWKFDVYPCMCYEQKLGDIFSMQKRDLKKGGCNCCNMSWYRDFSIYFQGFKSLIPILNEIKRIASYK